MNVDELAADDAELASRWLGRTINNKYVVQSVVGSGGMAVVYAVKHRNGKRFALKMLHRELSLNPFIRQRFVREGYVANRVEHEGAVAVIDDDITDDGSAFLVMDLLHGVTLERLWEANGSRLTLECVLAISAQLLDVLAAAHAQNIVHRDLKPANVFVTRNGLVKILDFGIARLREGDGSKTESGTTLGTPLFMPPEQASGRSRDIDARTDLWAVGATMFSSLTGQYVHDGENAAQVLISVATTPSRSLASVLPDAPPQIVELVDKALAFYNEDRWDSAVVMREAVLAAQAKLGLHVAPEFLGQIVRVTAPGGSNTDVQSTPVTTPAPSDGFGRTERMPATPSQGSGLPLSGAGASMPVVTPSMGATKRSAQVPVKPVVPGELMDSSARAMSAQTLAPQHRSKSRAVFGVVAVAGLAGAGVFASRYLVTDADRVPSPTVATPLVSTPVATAPPSVAPLVSTTPLERSSPPDTADSAGAPEAIPSAAGGVKPLRKPPRGVKSPPLASEKPSLVSAPPPTTTPPVVTTPPPSATSTPTAAPHKPPPSLDRTSPFGN
jgi:serine/threonine protein kinase